MNKSIDSALRVSPLFTEKWAAWFFLPLRLWLGWQWIEAGWHKIVSPAWMVTGTALQGYWTKAVVVNASGSGAISYDWYRSFIQFLLDSHSNVWFAKFVALGELAVGVALILGVFVGVSAFFGGLMNWNYMMAGTASTNPMLFVISIILMLGWRVAGYIGADYYLLNWTQSVLKRWRR